MDPASVQRATAAATELVASLGLAVDKAVILHDSNALTLRLLPCDLVARIAPVGRNVAEHEVERALRLTEAGAPVGALDPRVPPRVHVRDGFALTAWIHYPSLARGELPADEYARALAALHEAMRAVDLDAPPLTDRIGSALALLDDPARTPALPTSDRDVLRETLRRLGDAVTAGGREQLLHGEPHPGNVLDAPGGPRFIDLETFCRGPVEFDLAHAPADVAAHYPGADPALLAGCRILSLALATTWRWDREDTLPNGHHLGVRWLQQVRSLSARHRSSA